MLCLYLASGWFKFLLYYYILNIVMYFWMMNRWTFTLLIIYFGCGSVLSAYGCYRYSLRSLRSNVSHFEKNMEQGSYTPLMCQETTNIIRERNISNPKEDDYYIFRMLGILTYVFEIMFQMNAGAVTLTDSIYWFVIFPFLTIKDYNLTFMTVDMHTVNVILLLGDTALNCLPVPLFRISFFILWTGVFVIFQWIIHACISIWWPYPFLDLSSPYAPLWYLLAAIMHLPCYGIFALIVKMKRYLLAKWFPFSCQC